MQGGAFAASFLFHAAIVLALSLSFTLGGQRDLLDIPQVISVDLVSIGDETIIKPPPPKEPVEEVPPAPPVAPSKAEQAPAEPDEETALAQEAAPAPPEVLEKIPDPDPAPTPELEKVEEPEPKTKGPSKVNEADALDNFAKLIDRSKETPKTADTAEDDFFATFGKERPATQVADSRDQSISLIDAARNQVQKCWTPPLGARDAASMRVRVSVLLGPDGEIIGVPTLDDADRRRMGRSNETVFRVFAESAVRAVRQCAPFTLPKERYNEWRALRLNFDPSQMLN